MIKGMTQGLRALVTTARLQDYADLHERGGWNAQIDKREPIVLGFTRARAIKHAKELIDEEQAKLSKGSKEELAFWRYPADDSETTTRAPVSSGC